MLWSQEFGPDMGTSIILFSKYSDVDVRGQPGERGVRCTAQGYFAGMWSPGGTTIQPGLITKTKFLFSFQDHFIKQNQTKSKQKYLT